MRMKGTGNTKHVVEGYDYRTQDIQEDQHGLYVNADDRHDDPCYICNEEFEEGDRIYIRTLGGENRCYCNNCIESYRTAERL